MTQPWSRSWAASTGCHRAACSQESAATDSSRGPHAPAEPQGHTSGPMTHGSGNPQPASTCKATGAHQRRRAAKGPGELEPGQVKGLGGLPASKPPAHSSIPPSPAIPIPAHQLLVIHSHEPKLRAGACSQRHIGDPGPMASGARTPQPDPQPPRKGAREMPGLSPDQGFLQTL